MPHALDVLAAAYAELGEFKEAAAWQRKLLEQLPSQAPPQIKRAVAERLGCTNMASRIASTSRPVMESERPACLAPD